MMTALYVLLAVLVVFVAFGVGYIIGKDSANRRRR